MILPISKDLKLLQQKSGKSKTKPKRSFKEVMNKDQLIKPAKMSVFDCVNQAEKKNLKDNISNDCPPFYQECKIEIQKVEGKTEVFSISELSPVMQDLVNQMANYITIESQNGISTIEYVMELKDAFGKFQGTIIRIDHYDTHPNSFNILLMNSNTSAIEDLTAHLPSLLKTLQTKLENFQINLLPPSYPETSQLKTVRSSNKTDKAEDKKRDKLEKLKKIPF